MEVLKRERSLVTLRDKKGKLWLTRRHKPRRDNRRRRQTRVIHFPIRRIVEKGDWIFTCSMKPLQFGEWQVKPESSRKEYPMLREKEWEEFKNDDFTTMEGSHHSKKHCSLTPISDEYAKFFNDHKLWELLDINYKDFEKYEKAVKAVCESFKIKFEGI